jgi:Tol biopolymer transport system component/tRNA A-37 threonylcarbamoyl transferase component Bud32
LTITSGTRLGRYEIRSQIGAGGMGEVYRARDEKLNRDVAIKVLPAELSQNADRLRRFEQEAQAAGALNHPNILAVYDVGTHDGAPYVVSELLEGESVKERLDDGTIAQRKATDYALQVAHGLAAAHEKGIVHRDLKPDNLFITNDDRVKILDFGIAKLIEPVGEGVAQTDIATRKVQTDPGTVMGTVGYMSPEQVRGRHVDHRSDIFSFGAVLYEMLSGQRAFRGDSAVETLNAILKEEPAELSARTNRNISPALERVVWHCLEKSPERRFQSARDVAFALENVSATSSGSTQTGIVAAPLRAKNRERLIWIGVSALILVAVAALAFAYLSRTQTAAHSVRLSLAAPFKASLPARVTVSPDGLRIAFIANNAEGKRVLWVRPLDSLTAQPLVGTDGAVSPFWSPDSRLVGYFANGKLFKVDASGGRPQALCDVGESRGGAWNSDGVILFSGLEGLYRVSAQGGAPVLATKVAPKEEAHRWPYFLPDGRHFVFLADAATTEDHHIRVGSLESQESQILFGAVSRIVYAPPGYLLYVSQGALVALTFDARALKVTGDPTTIAEHIAEVGDNHEFDFSVSDDGVLAYQSGNPNSQLTWFDRTGKKLNSVGESANYDTVSLSPDERRAAVTLLDADGRIADVWLLDLTRDSISRLTFDPSGEGNPVWSPDSNNIVYSSNRLGGGQVNLYEKAASGAGDDQLLLQSATAKYATSWLRDGQFILFENWPLRAKAGIWLLPLTGERQPKPLLQTVAFDQTGGQFSPDGRFVAYMSNESGRTEVYVRPFPLSDDKWPISSGGGQRPLWRADGKELFYVTEGRLMSAEIRASGKFESSVPEQLFRTNIKNQGDGLCYAAAADGQRFLVNTFVEGDNPAPMIVVLNWTADLKH